MHENCFICSIKPILYFSSFSYAFVGVRCSHSKNSTESSIRKSPTRRTIGFAFYLLLVIISCYELYVDFTFTKFSLFSILTVTELISMTVGLCRNFLNNVYHLEKLKELQMMLSIAEYTAKFNVEDRDYERKRKLALIGIASCVLSNSLPMAYFLYDDVNVSTLLMGLNRFVLGVLLTSRYFQCLYEFSYYSTFLKRTFTQIEREIKERLAVENNLKIIYRNALLFPSHGGGFLRRIKKLRKFYIVILSSFRRTKKMTNSAMVTVVLGYYLLLSLMLCIVVMGVRGDIHLHAGHYLYVAKHCAFVTHLVCFAIVCGRIEDLVQEMLTVLFKVPLEVLGKEESREVELLTSLVAKEKPININDDAMDYGKHILTLLVVDVVTNCMVVIQLYFWFQKLSEEEAT